MIIANLRLAIRHLGSQKFNTILHIIGLTLGISVCLLIALLLRYELSFDNYHDKADRTYRITTEYSDAGKTVRHFSTPLPLSESLRTGVTGLENVTLAHPFESAQIEITSGKRFIQKNILVAEPDILDVFNIEVIAGNGYDALRKPYHSLITETAAKRFFGSENPLGKIFRLNNAYEITVAGIIRDQPSNTHLPFSMLLSFVREKKFLGIDPADWSMTMGNATYVVVPETPDAIHLETQLKDIADQHINADPNMPRDIRCDLTLQSLGDIHFQAQYGSGGPWVQAVNVTWLWFFALIGLLVLALACINFVNLSTAQALTRAREVGIRKTMGAARSQLMAQFLMESCLLTLIAGIFAIALAQTSLPWMNALLGKHIVFDPLQSPGLLAALFTTSVVTGLLAGVYPAWLIARFNPTQNLKPGSPTRQNIGSAMLRKALVVGQFSISIGLLIAVGLIAQQINFIREKDLGFRTDNIINIPIGSASSVSALAGLLNQIPQVKHFSFATGSPATGEHWGGMISPTDGNDPDRVLITTIPADENFTRVYDLKLIAGHLPAPSYANDTATSAPRQKQAMKILVNEKLVRELGLKSNEDAIGEHFWISMGGEDAEIIGVVADFNTQSLHSPVNATIITNIPQAYKQAGIRIESNTDILQAVEAIEGAWKKTYPEEVFEVHFLDQAVDNHYRSEARLYTLFKVFAALAMCISCLGLWGLAAFAAQRRTKEIGIRKVLGASVKSIAILLTKDFLSMVLIAVVVSAPFAYYFMNDWLQTFAYRVNIGWEVFIVAGLASLIVALLTVSVHTLKSALSNPVNSLRSE